MGLCRRRPRFGPHGATDRVQRACMDLSNGGGGGEGKGERGDGEGGWYICPNLINVGPSPVRASRMRTPSLTFQRPSAGCTLPTAGRSRVCTAQSHAAPAANGSTVQPMSPTRSSAVSGLRANRATSETSPKTPKKTGSQPTKQVSCERKAKPRFDTFTSATRVGRHRRDPAAIHGR